MRCRRLQRFAKLLTTCCLLLVSGPSAFSQSPLAVDLQGSRLTGVQIGPHRVGFETRTATDGTRRINSTDVATKFGVAIWYPAQGGADRPPMTSLDYRMLEFATEPAAAAKQRYRDNEADQATAWRHVGIVPLDRPQALASLSTAGIAIRDSPRLQGKFPVVMILGGQYYLSTTAEVLASHGFMVAAPFRFRDYPNEVGTADFTAYLENSVRDAEWLLNDLASSGSADVTRVSVLGHGGGGLQALLFAMRNRGVSAVANIDAGNFSTRTEARRLPFYRPRLLHAPFLYIATADTKAGQDQFEDFNSMKFSDRFEVVIEEPALRHHDLSDLGRGVTVLGMRGEPQARVQQAFANVQQMIVRFFTASSGAAGRRLDDFAVWLRARSKSGPYGVAIYVGVTPAPAPEAVTANVGAGTPGLLRESHRLDPEAPVFQAGNLERIVVKALTTGQFALAEALADFALVVHPGTLMFQDHRSEALEGRGETARSREVATACAAVPPGQDWRTALVVARCAARAERLGSMR